MSAHKYVCLSCFLIVKKSSPALQIWHLRLSIQGYTYQRWFKIRIREYNYWRTLPSLTTLERMYKNVASLFRCSTSFAVGCGRGAGRVYRQNIRGQSRTSLPRLRRQIRFRQESRKRRFRQRRLCFYIWLVPFLTVVLQLFPLLIVLVDWLLASRAERSTQSFGIYLSKAKSRWRYNWNQEEHQLCWRSRIQ